MHSLEVGQRDSRQYRHRIVADRRGEWQHGERRAVAGIEAHLELAGGRLRRVEMDGVTVVADLEVEGYLADRGGQSPDVGQIDRRQPPAGILDIDEEYRARSLNGRVVLEIQRVLVGAGLEVLAEVALEALGAVRRGEHVVRKVHA